MWSCRVWLQLRKHSSGKPQEEFEVCDYLCSWVTKQETVKTWIKYPIVRKFWKFLAAVHCAHRNWWWTKLHSCSEINSWVCHVFHVRKDSKPVLIHLINLFNQHNYQRYRFVYTSTQHTLLTAVYFVLGPTLP